MNANSFQMFTRESTMNWAAQCNLVSQMWMEGLHLPSANHVYKSLLDCVECHCFISPWKHGIQGQLHLYLVQLGNPTRTRRAPACTLLGAWYNSREDQVWLQYLVQGNQLFCRGQFGRDHLLRGIVYGVTCHIKKGRKLWHLIQLHHYKPRLGCLSTSCNSTSYTPIIPCWIWCCSYLEPSTTFIG